VTKHATEHQESQGQRRSKRPLHRSLAVWFAVLLMLLAMGIYLISMDESIRPHGPAQPPVPAAP
jgi:hypothetical protein